MLKYGLNMKTLDDENFYALKSVELQRLDFANGMFYKTFKFKGKGEAHIGLFEKAFNVYGKTENVGGRVFYEVILGGWRNTKSVIRQRGMSLERP